MSNTSKDFWEFSWDQIAQYDLPAKVDFILNQTNRSSLLYVGHSEGTMIGFAEFSHNPALADKIDLFVALAPVTFLNHVAELIQIAADVPDFIIHLIFGDKGIYQPWTKMAEKGPTDCSRDPGGCADGICLVAGCESRHNYNYSRMPTIFSHFPSGSSVQNLLHYKQSVKSGLFQ